MEKEKQIQDFTIQEIIEYFGKEQLLSGLGYDEDMCFETDVDLTEYVIDNSEWIGIPLFEKFEYMNDQRIYERTVELLESCKIPHNEWDKFLREYE